MKTQIYKPKYNSKEMEDKTFVINIGRQLGSGGKEIGLRLAEMFGITCYDNELIKRAA